jgi:uncharacterized protein YceK
MNMISSFKFQVSSLVLLLALSGCSSFKKMTASEQWIEVDLSTNNMELVMIHEKALASGDQTAAIMSLYALGTAKASGPADITRTVDYCPSNGNLRVSLQTKNSEWLGGMFRGLWSSASAIGDWLATAAAGAAP